MSSGLAVVIAKLSVEFQTIWAERNSGNKAHEEVEQASKCSL
jgi:hypothetical protein